MDLFMRQVAYYDDKVEKARSFMTDVRIQTQLDKVGWSKDKLKDSIESNNSEFIKFVLDLAKFIMPGRVSCTSYAAVVARLMDYVGIQGYRYIAGFCLPESGKNYQEDKQRFEERRLTETHPVVATHVFIFYNNTYYEIFNGETSGIDHIDCIDMNTKVVFTGK